MDVHFHCWNLTIRDCTIGSKGISVTGGGELLVENTVRHGNAFIGFRPDYGSRWDGRIRLQGCTLRPTDEGPVRVLAYGPHDFDYGYPVGYARSIEIEDLVVDYAAVPHGTAPCWLMQTAGFSRLTHGGRLFFPRHITWRHIRVAGRSQGVRLLRLVDAGHLDLAAEGAADQNWLTPNCSILCEDVQLEQVVPAQPDDVESAHLVIAADATAASLDPRALILRLRFADCDGLFVVLDRAVASVRFERCTVNLVRAPGLHGELVFSDCRLRPQVGAAEDTFFRVDSSLGTRFTDCTVHAPVVGGRVAPDLVDRSGILQVNGAVPNYHANTGLGPEILAHWRQQGRTLDPAFVARLRSHHLLEG